MTETTDLALLEIKPEQAPALYAPNGLDAFLEQIRQSVNEVPDLSTAKGRARVASLAAQVSRSKTAIEKPGRDYLKRLKELPKEVEAELRRFVTTCDAIRDETRQPLTDWEAEQERIKAEEALAAAHAEALEMNEAFDKVAAEKLESDHEIALLMNDKFDRDRAEAARLAEQQRIEHEQRIAREAEERVKREAEEKAKRDREEVERRERELQAAAEREKQERIAAEQRAEQQRIEAQQLAERQAREAREKAEREKQQAIEVERRKAAQAEQARIAEEKRIKDEAERRARSLGHRRNINLAAVSALVESGLTEDCAKACITAIAKGQVPAVNINY